MRTRTQHQLVTAALGIVFLTGACGSGSTAPEVGSFEATVSGDLTTTLAGSAIFGMWDVGTGGQWMIYMPETTAAAFQVVAIGPEGSVARLQTGTYDIVEATTAGEGEVVGVFLSFSGTVTEIFGSADGTLTISESNDDGVRGTFEFTAVELDSDGTIKPDGRQVTVSGEFVAIAGTVPSISRRR
jgi:hypothetical protein